MNTYKIGDRVTIRNDLNYSHKYRDYCITSEMINRKGEKVIIREIRKTECYKIETLDKCIISCVWPVELFEKSVGKRYIPLELE